MLGWEESLDAVRDSRRQPQIPTRAIIRSVVVMLLSRLGSLNALDQSGPSRFWPRWLGGPLPSADTVGRVCALAHLEDIRRLNRHLYSQLKRNKALAPPAHGLMTAIVDAHESHATYRRRCSGCLERVVDTREGPRVQYYHRYVALQLVGRDSFMVLDIEPLAPGEDEVAAALRLLDRVRAAYPRAFDVVIGDALYADSRFFNWALDHGKDALAVLKDDRRDLSQDARSLFERTVPVTLPGGPRHRVCWDIEGFTTWPQVCQPVRVVRSLEKQSVRRQLDGQLEERTSEWMWVTTLSQARASTAAVVHLGHTRWSIENQDFNETVNRWYADHVYKHEPTAMVAFWLLVTVCLNLFLAFYRRNLKPALRRAASMLHIARLIASELYAGMIPALARAPP